MAPEVRAARQEAGAAPGHPIKAVAQTELTGVSLEYLVTEMGAAHRVDILGVLPRALGEALLAADGDQPPPRPADRFTYLTPRRERVLAYRHENVMGRVIQRWSAGLVCFRNWTERWAAQVHREEGEGNVYPIDDLFLECIVMCGMPSRTVRVFALNLLPQPDQASQPDVTPAESLVITEVADGASVDKVLERIAALRAGARPAIARGLICANRGPGAAAPAPAPGSLPAEFVPGLVGIQSYGSARPAGAVMPVAVVALYADSARGAGLLLKHRTVFNSRNDFETLSLVAERVMEEDLALAVARDVPDHVPDRDVLDHWWKALQKPVHIEVPVDAFVAAAQREVFVATGLDIASDRYELCGSLVLEREGFAEYLGFVGFRVVLRRDDEIDELMRAMRWNSDLTFVLVDELYRATGDGPDSGRPHRLNRLLSRRPDWVKSVLLADPAGTGAARGQA